MSRVKTFDAGRFNRQLIIENEVETADGCGGYYSNYQATDTIWAHICPVGANVNSSADTNENRITHKITVRFRSGVSAGTRFVTGSRRFYVDTVHDPDESGRYLECHAVERA